jgi:hypothetical protein
MVQGEAQVLDLDGAARPFQAGPDDKPLQADAAHRQLIARAVRMPPASGHLVPPVLGLPGSWWCLDLAGLFGRKAKIHKESPPRNRGH